MKSLKCEEQYMKIFQTLVVSEITMSKVNNSFGVKIYDLPLNRFANVALPQFLEQLQQHKNNLNKVRLSLFSLYFFFII